MQQNEPKAINNLRGNSGRQWMTKRQLTQSSAKHTIHTGCSMEKMTLDATARPEYSCTLQSGSEDRGNNDEESMARVHLEKVFLHTCFKLFKATNRAGPSALHHSGDHRHCAQCPFWHSEISECMDQSLNQCSGDRMLTKCMIARESHSKKAPTQHSVCHIDSCKQNWPSRYNLPICLSIKGQASSCIGTEIDLKTNPTAVAKV